MNDIIPSLGVHDSMLVRRPGISTMVLAVSVIIIVAIAAVAVVYASMDKGSSGSTGVNSSSTSTVSLDFSGPLSLSAGGSSFVNPVMQEWIFAYQALTSGQVTIIYEPTGSGAGISGIFAGLYDFAGSDAPVSQSYLNANAPGRTLLQIPETLGGVAIFYNIPGVKQSLNLTGSVLESIYDQNITKWNDPRITALNPGISLPDYTIVVVHRSDGSGTTFALTTYFSKIDPTWATRIGVGTFVDFPNTPNPELSGKGSGGVAALVNETDYSIGYADTYYAFNNGLTTAAIQNSAGVFLKPSVASVAAAAAAFSTQLQSNATFSITDAPGAASYPISTFTYLLVFAHQTSQERADAIATFFWYIVHQGQMYGPKLLYPELPSGIVTTDEGLLSQITYNGQSYVP
jgi:phosphate transport system substrate-binding protein